MKKIIFLLPFILFNITESNSQVCFNTQSDFDAGDNPLSVTCADFNGDTKTDIAAVNLNSSDISIVLGNGDGTFGSGSFITSPNTTTGPKAITSADFNGDGKIDLAVVDFKPDTVSVFWGNGMGGFNVGVELNLPGPLIRITTGYFNADLIPDLVVLRNSSSATPNLFVLLGTGFGFAAPINLTTDDYPRGLTVADMNNDGNSDIVIGSPGKISIFPGTGVGGFSSSLLTLTSAPSVQYLTHADFNEDNKEDILISTNTSDYTKIGFGNGMGGFSSFQLVGENNNSSAVAADLNNDSHIDMAISKFNEDKVYVSLGIGDGTFLPSYNTYYTVYTVSNFIESADFNSDGRIDLVITNSLAPTNNSSVLINTPPPVISVTASDTTKCWGDSLTFTATGAADFDIPNGIPFVLNPDSTTLFHISGHNGNCWSNPVDITIYVGLEPKQDLCVVTTDSATGNHNVIVWEKDGNDDIDSIVIYREFGLNVYNRVGAVHYDSLSLFHDYSANPNATSYKYRVTGKNECGIEDSLSGYHNSIHLQYLGFGNFQWTPYEIEGMPNQVFAYNFYRDNTGTGNFQLIGIIPGGNQTYTDINYSTYPDALYRVDLTWISSHSCVPTRTAVNTSRSNIKGQVEIGIETNGLENLIRVFPNPSNGIFNLQVPHELIGEKVLITDALGKVVFSWILQDLNNFVDLTLMSDGIYFMNITGSNENLTKKLIRK